MLDLAIVFFKIFIMSMLILLSIVGVIAIVLSPIVLVFKSIRNKKKSGPETPSEHARRNPGHVITESLNDVAKCDHDDYFPAITELRVVDSTGNENVWELDKFLHFHEEDSPLFQDFPTVPIRIPHTAQIPLELSGSHKLEWVRTGGDVFVLRSRTDYEDPFNMNRGRV